MRVTRWRFWSILFLLSVVVPCIGDDHERISATHRRTMKRVVNQLIIEAKQIRETKAVFDAKPDFALRCEPPLDVPDQLILATVFARVHDDPFVDGYVRWQLISFKPVLPELNDRQFAMLMDQTPPMVENPWADSNLLVVMKQVDQAGPLADSDLQRIKSLRRRLEQQERRAEVLNQPARYWRAWVADQLGNDGPRFRQWLIEECVATINGGWPTRTIKSRLSRALTESTFDSTFTRDQRAMVGDQLRRCAGLKRKFVSQITFFANGAVDVSFSTAQISRSNVKKWIERMEVTN